MAKVPKPTKLGKRGPFLVNESANGACANVESFGYLGLRKLSLSVDSSDLAHLFNGKLCHGSLVIQAVRKAFRIKSRRVAVATREPFGACTSAIIVASLCGHIPKIVFAGSRPEMGWIAALAVCK